MTNAALLGLVAAGLALPAAREAIRRPVSVDQHDADARFVQLSHGLTHYTWHGKDHGPVAVCVHGLTTPSPVWNGLVTHLTGMGYRVLTYDLFGRGLSDRPRRYQTTGFFNEQLSELLDALDIPDEVTLIGYSMGGAIATGFAATHPDRLRHLVLVAPAGMGHDLGRVSQMAVELPVLGDWLFHLAYPSLLRRSIRRDRDDPIGVPDIKNVQMQELKRRGFLRSVLSSLRGTLRRPMQAQHNAVAKAQVPVFAIFGAQDTVIPLRGLGTLTQWNRQVQSAVVDGAGHGLVYTHTPQVAEALRRGLLKGRT